MFRIIRFLVLVSVFFSVYGSDDHNAILECLDGSKIHVGRNLGIQEEIDKKLSDDIAYQAIHMNVPFTTGRLEDTLSDLEKKAQWGTRVHVNTNTGRVLRNENGKKVVGSAVKSGLFSFRNSQKLHDKQALFLEKSEEGEKRGTLFFGTGNRSNNEDMNEETWFVSTQPKDIARSEKILESYEQVTHEHDGGKPIHTPKKDTISWRGRKKEVRSPKPKAYSTVDTDMLETRKKLVTQKGVGAVYHESMTGPAEFLGSVSPEVPVHAIVDRTAIKPHEAAWKKLLQDHPNIQLLVRTNTSNSHHAKLTAVKVGEQCLVEVSTANNTQSSSEDLNSSFIKQVKTLSPLKRRYDQLSKENNFVEGSPTLTKVLARIDTTERPAKRLKTTHTPSASPVADSLAEVTAVAATLSALPPLSTTTTTTTTTTTPSIFTRLVKRKLSFGGE